MSPRYSQLNSASGCWGLTSVNRPSLEWRISEQNGLSTASGSKTFYYMAKLVLGTSLCSDWFFLGQDFAVRTVFPTRVFLFWSRAGKFQIRNQMSGKKTVNIVILHIFPAVT